MRLRHDPLLPPGHSGSQASNRHLQPVGQMSKKRPAVIIPAGRLRFTRHACARAAGAGVSRFTQHVHQFTHHLRRIAHNCRVRLPQDRLVSIRLSMPQARGILADEHQHRLPELPHERLIMPSPFPGMDPYLEGYLWADVHQALAYQFRKQLAPLVEPTYAVRLSVYMLTDRAPAHELGILYPDVEVVRPHRPTERAVRETAHAVAISPAPVSIPLSVPVQARIVSVEVRDAANNRLVTSIEIVSPANKREPGLTHLQAKRDELRMSNVHVLEIDLIRRGMRAWPTETVPRSPYLAALVRAGHIHAEIWPIGLRERLPILPVPLRSPDPDVPLDVQAALDTVYDEARYALTINYAEAPPEPPLPDVDTA